MAQKLATAENIILTSEHWDIIHFFRYFYNEYQLTPSMRILIKYLKQQWPEEKATSVYLQKLFPKSFMLQVCFIAGLPKPKRCL